MASGSSPSAGDVSSGFVLETHGLTKRYGKLTAVNHLSLEIKKGEIYGFLGLNGAGKTTTIRMLLGMIRPDEGEVRLLGKTVGPNSAGPWDRTGYLVELPYSYPELTVRENLEAVRKLRGIHDRNAVSRIIGLLKLDAYENVRARNLSLGNNQRLGLAKALIHDPEILILDEPSNSLDPSGIVEIRELLLELAGSRGITIFISSHNLDEISRIASRIGIIHNGVLVRETATDQLLGGQKKNLVIDTLNNAAAGEFLGSRNIPTYRNENGLLVLPGKEAVENPAEINRLLVTSGHVPRMLAVEQEDLESYFLRTVSGKAEGENQ